MSCAYIYTGDRCTSNATQYLDQPFWRWRCNKHKKSVGLIHMLGRGKNLSWERIPIISTQLSVKYCTECKIQAKGAFHEAEHGVLEDYYIVDIELIQRECLNGRHLRVIDIRNERIHEIRRLLIEGRLLMDLINIVYMYTGLG